MCVQPKIGGRVHSPVQSWVNVDLSNERGEHVISEGEQENEWSEGGWGEEREEGQKKGVVR